MIDKYLKLSYTISDNNIQNSITKSKNNNNNNNNSNNKITTQAVAEVVPSSRSVQARFS